MPYDEEYALALANQGTLRAATLPFAGMHYCDAERHAGKNILATQLFLLLDNRTEEVHVLSYWSACDDCIARMKLNEP
jgi:hypothetical protein